MLKNPLIWLFIITVGTMSITFTIFEDWKRFLGLFPVLVMVGYLVYLAIKNKKKAGPPPRTGGNKP